MDSKKQTHDKRKSFLHKSQVTTKCAFFNFQVINDDSLPQHLCDECEQDVNKYFEKINKCNAVEKKWVEQLQNQNPSHPFLTILKLVEVSVNIYFENLPMLTHFQTYDDTLFVFMCQYLIKSFFCI